MSARRRLRPGWVTAAVLVAILLAACGSSTLSDTQLRSRAARICTLAAQRTERIGTPTLPTEETAFLRRGIVALAPEVTALGRLRAPDDVSDDYRDAVAATAAELASLRSTVKGLRAGNDPIVAIKTLQQQLAPVEARASRAWTDLELPACRGD